MEWMKTGQIPYWEHFQEREVKMLFDDKMALWIKRGGEVDLPRNPEANWGVAGEVAYR